MRRKKLYLLVAMFVFASTVVHAGDALKTISRKLADASKKQPKLSMAVMDFPYSRNRFSTGSQLVSERLVTYLVQDGAIVVERRLLEKIFEERRLWETGLTNPAIVKNVGNILGVDAIVTGLLSDVTESTTEVLARLIKVDTGEILAAATVVMRRLWADLPRLPRAAQPRSAVPMTSLPLDPSEQSISSVEKKDPLEHTPGTRRRYFPAPVPGLIPTTLPTAKRGPAQ